MKWITREKVKVDRVACPWLIRRFIDREAEFLGDVVGIQRLRFRDFPECRVIIALGREREAQVVVCLGSLRITLDRTSERKPTKNFKSQTTICSSTTDALKRFSFRPQES